jgi:hypothetical protein
MGFGSKSVREFVERKRKIWQEVCNGFFEFVEIPSGEAKCWLEVEND